MNILICTLEYAHYSQNYTGGIGSFYKEYSKQLMLHDETNSVYILCLSTTKFTGKDEKVNIEFYKPYGFTSKMYRFINTTKKLFRPFSFCIDFYYRFMYSLKVKKIVQTQKIDIIETHDFKGICSLFKLVGIKTPIVIRAHGANKTLSDLKIHKVNKTSIFHEKIVNKLFDSFIFISKSSKKYYEDSFSKKENNIICYNSLSLHFESKNKVSDYTSKINVCNFGAMSTTKGVGLFIQLACFFKEDPEFQFHLIGKDTSDFPSDTLANYSNINYHGMMSHDELLNKIKKFDIFIFPTHFENCPMSWIEAMQLHSVILVSNIDVSREIVLHNATGFICNDFKDYVTYLNKLKDSLYRKKISLNAKKFSDKKFAPKKMVYSSIAFYKRNINAK